MRLVGRIMELSMVRVCYNHAGITIWGNLMSRDGKTGHFVWVCCWVKYAMSMLCV